MSNLDPNAIAELKDRIEAELKELEQLTTTAAEDSAPVELDQQLFGRVSRVDAMRVQAMAVVSGQRRAGRINILKAALERIASGDYGFCSQCDEAIAAGRIKADPAAALCLTCAGSAKR